MAQLLNLPGATHPFNLFSGCILTHTITLGRISCGFRSVEGFVCSYTAQL